MTEGNSLLNMYKTKGCTQGDRNANSDTEIFGDFPTKFGNYKKL